MNEKRELSKVPFLEDVPCETHVFESEKGPKKASPEMNQVSVRYMGECRGEVWRGA